MLLSFTDICKKYSIRPNGIIQVGSHFAQEHPEYVRAGVKRIVYIEPCKAAYMEMSSKYAAEDGVLTFNVACGEEQGIGTMYTGDNTINKGQSNSLLKPDLHLSIHPEVEFDGQEEVEIVTLDSLGLANKGYDFLNMDCQGFEDRVLRGATETLKSINWIYTELNFGSVYSGNALVGDIDLLLSEFERVETGPLVGGLWTDGLYIRKSILKN